MVKSKCVSFLDEMASNDDDEQTIETDSEGPSMTPRSSNVQRSFDRRTNNNLDYLPNLPLHLQIENTDAVIINSEKDRLNANKFQQEILKSRLVTKDGKCVKPKVMLVDEIPGSEQDKLANIRIALKKTNYIFLFASKFLCESNILSRLDSILLNFMQDAEKQRNIIPVNTKSKKYRDYHLPAFYSGVKAIEFWSMDQLYLGNVKQLFELRIENRLKRDNDLMIERNDYTKQQISGKSGEKPTVGEAIDERMSRLGVEEKEDIMGLRVKNQSFQKPYKQDQQQQSRSDSRIEMDGPVSSVSHNPRSCYQGQPTHMTRQAHQEHNMPIPTDSTIWPTNQMMDSTHQNVPRGFFQSYQSESTQSGTSLEAQASSCRSHDSVFFMKVKNENGTIQHVPIQVYPMITAHQQGFMSNSQGVTDHNRQSLVSDQTEYTNPSRLANNPPQTMMDTAEPPSQQRNIQRSASTATYASHQKKSRKSQHGSSPADFASANKNVTNIFNITIENVENAAIGTNAKFINKSCKVSSEDEDDDSSEDSTSSECSESPKEAAEMNNERSKDDDPVFTRSQGGNIATADGDHHPSMSASGLTQGGQCPSDVQGPPTQADLERTHPEFFIPDDRESGIDTNTVEYVFDPDIFQTQVKQVVDDMTDHCE